MELEQIVRRKTGVGQEEELCQVVATSDHPTATLLTSDGQRITWAQHLTRPATPEEIVEYWKASAESWKRRAGQHGCNTTEGDHECA
jgi:hypothetical protein